MSEAFVPKIVDIPDFGRVVQIVDADGNFVGYDPSPEQINAVAAEYNLGYPDRRICVAELAIRTKWYYGGLVNEGISEADYRNNTPDYRWNTGAGRLRDLMHNVMAFLGSENPFPRDGVQETLYFPNERLFSRAMINDAIDGVRETRRYYEGGNND